MGFILPGLERDRIFPQFFRGIGMGQDFFCGSGTGEVWKSTPVSPYNLDSLAPPPPLSLSLSLLSSLLFFNLSPPPSHSLSPSDLPPLSSPYLSLSLSLSPPLLSIHSSLSPLSLSPLSSSSLPLLALASLSLTSRARPADPSPNLTHNN